MVVVFVEFGISLLYHAIAVMNVEAKCGVLPRVFTSQTKAIEFLIVADE